MPMAINMLVGVEVPAKAEQTTEVDTPTEAEPKTTLSVEIGPEGKVEAPANRANAKAATSRPKGKVDWPLMDEMSAAKKEAAKNEVSSILSVDGPMALL